MSTIIKNTFGITLSGESVYQYSLINSKNTIVNVLNYGGIIKNIIIQVANGQKDLVLGYDNLCDYESDTYYFGAIIGRNSNRIKNAEFKLGRKKYTLEKNDGNNNLHSGSEGFHKRVWNSSISDNSLILKYTSPNGEEGFPGNLTVTVEYTLNDDNELKLKYTAKSDRDTVVNLTNHSYFNLDGQISDDILNHELKINANSITEINNEYIPTGRIINVKATPFDFNSPKKIGERINSESKQMVYGNGYDHNYVLNGSGMRTVAEVTSKKSKITLTVKTDMPCMQFYSGNFLDKVVNGKYGKVYTKRGGFCLEAQRYPDAVNIISFPTSILLKGQEYESCTIYKFTNE